MIPQYKPPLQGLARLGYVMPTAWTLRHSERDTTTRFLDRLADIPDPLETMGEFERYYHIDLASMTPSELRQDLRRVQLRLLLEEQPHSWLRAQEAAIRNALRERRAQR